MKVTGSPSMASEKTKEPIKNTTNSDSENSETGAIKEKFVAYTESSELEDETGECCHNNVDCDSNTDRHNDKDPLVGGKPLPADAQPSSDIEDFDEEDDIHLSDLAMLEEKKNEKKKVKTYSQVMMRTDPIQW